MYKISRRNLKAVVSQMANSFRGISLFLPHSLL